MFVIVCNDGIEDLLNRYEFRGLATVLAAKLDSMFLACGPHTVFETDSEANDE